MRHVREKKRQGPKGLQWRRRLREHKMPSLFGTACYARSRAGLPQTPPPSCVKVVKQLSSRPDLAGSNPDAVKSVLPFLQHNKTLFKVQRQCETASTTSGSTIQLFIAMFRQLLEAFFNNQTHFICKQNYKNFIDESTIQISFSSLIRRLLVARRRRAAPVEAI